MIIDISGEQGSGKTLTLTFIGFLYYTCNFKILSTYEVRYPYKKFSIFDIFDVNFEYTPTMLLADDIAPLIDSRKSSSGENKLVTDIALLLRKKLCNLAYTQQISSMLDLRIRRQASYYIYPSVLPDDELIPFNEKTLRLLISNRSGVSFVMDLNPVAIAELYNSWEIVDNNTLKFEIRKAEITDYEHQFKTVLTEIPEIFEFSDKKSIEDLLKSYKLRDMSLNRLLGQKYGLKKLYAKDIKRQKTTKEK